jgi:tetratricopeptide (TPR) repeat protein
MELKGNPRDRLGDDLLVFFPPDANRARLGVWSEAHRALDGFVWSNLNTPHGEPRGELLRSMDAAQPLFQGDPILASSYWELESQALQDSGNFPTALKAKLAAFHQRSQQSAMDYFDLGKLYYQTDDIPHALDCWKKAQSLDPDLRMPPSWLEALESRAKR